MIYCWFDSEYTQLDPDRAELLEVALIATDVTLRPVGSKPESIPEELLTEDGFHARIEPPPDARISRHVLENYQPLLERCRKEGRPLAEIDRYLAAYLEQFPASRASDPRDRPILAGNSIYADYALVRKHLPELARRLSYRLLDVTSWKLEWRNHYEGEKFDKQNRPELVQRFYPGLDPVRGEKHDAYFDVQASIAELAFYRSHLIRR